MILFLTPPDKTYNAIEIHPCLTIEKGKDGKKDIVEVCEPEEAEFWSVYVRIVDGGLECVADCDTKKEAQLLLLFMSGVIENIQN